MVYLTKSQPAPECLAVEKAKANGDYKCGTVLKIIKNDFKNKCYICEFKEPISINIEHFVPHEGNIELKFDWNNLYYSCAHCNNIKLNTYINLLICTVQNDNVETNLRYGFKPFPFEQVDIGLISNDNRTNNTRDLLIAVYNGTTKLKTIESANLRNKLLDEIMDFQEHLKDYFRDTNTEEDRQYFLIKIRGHLHKGANFTAFKRWIIRDNSRLSQEFGQYIND